MKKHTQRVLALLGAVVMIAGVSCGEEDPDGGVGIDDGKADAWNRANDPANFGRDFEYNWEELNTEELRQGASKIIPWPDTYWPMSRDGYNQRWQGNDQMSPVELYDHAFNNWTPEEGFMELARFSGARTAYDTAYYDQVGPATRWAHEEGGHYRSRQIWNGDGTLTEDMAACDADGDNRFDTDNDLEDGEGTPSWCDFNGDDRVNSSDESHGIEGWWGHCHAWAPAAYMAPEPQRPVTVNDTTFEIADIKALIEATYEGGRSLFLGGRCNTRDTERDEFGRIIDVECRDTNPGAFHVVVVNRIGIRELSFVIDATYDYQVWNQPVRDYTINRQDEVDLTAALALIGRSDVTEYPYNDEAERFVHVEMQFRYVVEGSASRDAYIPRIDDFTRTHNYEYLLELDGEGNIIGGEWIDDAPHPDFMWAAVGANDVRAGGWGAPATITVANVQTLIDLSTSNEEPIVEGEDHAYDSEPALDIPDDDETGVSDTITVTDEFSIVGARVDVSITHTYRGDLTVELVRGEQTIELVRGEGGGQDNLIRSFPLSDFNDQNSVGDWTIRVIDEAGADTGTLDSWTLNLVAGLTR